LSDPAATGDDERESWQQRISELYTDIEQLYAHVDISVVLFDRHLVEVSTSGTATSALSQQLADIARRVLETGRPNGDVPLDRLGRQRAHGYPVADASGIAGVVCVVDDDGARRELFVRCAMAIFDGYRRNETALLERERRALDEARRANQLRDRFLAMVAHELKSPMATILLWERVLRDAGVDATLRTQALDAIHDAAAGQALLVEDLLDVSRAINGKLHMERRATAIGPALAQAIANVRPDAEARDVEIALELGDDVDEVFCDPRRLRQIFDNLLSNAIKSTTGGRVSVVARRDADTITIEVSDTGSGISADFLPHVFDAFRQSDERLGRGLGLGLAITRELVELHGGTITAASDGIGAGATFAMKLPRLGSPVATSGPPAIAGVRILLLDDDVQLLGALEVILAAAGAVVQTAFSASAARRILERSETDIVVSDLGMPGEDGLTFVKRLREEPGSSRSLPTIAITALAMDGDRERALAAGFDRYITKPIDVSILIRSIAELVS
jgi:signal transduction histidine kinase/CheY-like chemotaxis protein